MSPPESALTYVILLESRIIKTINNLQLIKELTQKGRYYRIGSVVGNTIDELEKTLDTAFQVPTEAEFIETAPGEFELKDTEQEA